MTVDIDKGAESRTMSGMITHVVLFWTHPPHQESGPALHAGARKLGDIPGVKNFRCGVPVPSPRDVVDDSFQVAISMDFEDAAAADAYQVHPDHVKFVEEVYKKHVGRCVVYDFETV